MGAWRRWLAILGAVLVTMLSIQGCSQGEQAQKQMQLQALWVGSNADGSPAQGVTPVTVALTDQPASGSEFSLDLTTEQAAGAGPAWNAAAWSAATVATLYSGIDPRKIGLSFSVSEAIDGPSAGGLLTVGVLCLIRNLTPAGDTTMTGTINPDGSIGYVGGIPGKIRASAAAGIKRILVPAGIAGQLDTATGKQVDLNELANSMGVTVTPVATIGEAFQLFTRQSLFPLAPTAPPIDPSMLTVIGTEARALASRIRMLARTATPAASAQADAIRVDGLRLLAASQEVAAYSVLWNGLQQLGQSIAAQATHKHVISRGLSSVATALVSQAQQVSRAAVTAVRTAAERTPTTLEQLTAIPDALSWPTYAQAAATVYAQRLTHPPVPLTVVDLTDASRAIASARLDVEVALPDALAASAAASGTPISNSSQLLSFLSAYTNFLVQAGKANQTYYENVTTPISQQGEKSSETRNVAYQVTRQLGETAATINKPAEPRSAELRELSDALSYFISGASLVAGAEIYRVAPSGSASTNTVIGDGQRFARAVATADETVANLADSLAAARLDSSYPRWSAAWGRSIALPAQTARPGPAADRLTGLEYIWFAAVQCLLLSAAAT